MLSLLKGAVQYGNVVRVIDEAFGETVQQRSEPVDRLGYQQAAGLQYPMRFLQRCQPLISLGQVVERAHQKDEVCNAFTAIERACVAPSHACQRVTRW